MGTEHLKRQIERAFADTPSPGDDPHAISDGPHDEGTAAYFQGTTWRGHTTISLRQHSVAMSFFTPQAFRYWLPAFMLAELDDPDEADVIAESIAFHLTPSKSHWNRLSEFTTAELDAIHAFLKECERRYPLDDNFSDAARAIGDEAATR